MKFTLLLTLVLVVLVIFLFLRNLSATVIPSLALPLSIVGTFAVMYMLGYSLDNLSLMALTLSVGFVVDDAIVMLENIVRHMEMGEKPLEAALDGSREIGFTILSMTISLAAVFIPVLFMGGIIGRLFHEFAVTIGVAILVSGFVSLTLTPMLCSRFLKPPREEQHGQALQVDREGLRRDARAVRADARPALAALGRSMLVLSALDARRDGLAVREDPEGLPADRGQGPIFGSTEGAEGIASRRWASSSRRSRRSSGADPDVAQRACRLPAARQRRRSATPGIVFAR